MVTIENSEKPYNKGMKLIVLTSLFILSLSNLYAKSAKTMQEMKNNLKQKACELKMVSNPILEIHTLESAFSDSRVNNTAIALAEEILQHERYFSNQDKELLYQLADDLMTLARLSHAQGEKANNTRRQAFDEYIWARGKKDDPNNTEIEKRRIKKAIENYELISKSELVDYVRVYSEFYRSFALDFWPQVKDLARVNNAHTKRQRAQSEKDFSKHFHSIVASELTNYLYYLHQYHQKLASQNDKILTLKLSDKVKIDNDYRLYDQMQDKSLVQRINSQLELEEYSFEGNIAQ